MKQNIKYINISEAEKEENDEYLGKLVRIFNDKENMAPTIAMILVAME